MSSVCYVRRFCVFYSLFFFQAEDGIRDLVRSRGLGDVYKRQLAERALLAVLPTEEEFPYTMRLVSEVISSNGSTSVSYTHLTLPTSDLV